MGNKTKILIVEDQIIAAEDLKKELKELDYNVTSLVRKGENVIDHIKEDHPDIVLMDIKLPGKLDGIETSKRVKNMFNIPVVYITAYSNSEVIERAKNIGSAGFITKPFSRKELYSNIEMALSRSRQKRKVQHLNRVLRSIRDVSKLITKEQNQNELLKRICKILVETRGYEDAWIALLEDSEIVQFVQQGLENPKKIRNILSREKNLECISKVSGDDQTTLNEIFSSDSRISCLDSMNINSNIMVSPLVYKDKRYGIIGINYKENLIIYEEELSLFHEMANDLAFALYKIEIEREREKAEKKLRNSEERYRTLTEFSPDPIIIHDGKKIHYINQAGMDLIDVKKKENIIGESAADFVHPDYKNLAARNIKAMLEKDETISNVEEKLVSKEGEVKYVEVSGQRIIYEGNPAIQLVVRDITKRKEAEKEKQKLEEQYRQSQKMQAVGQLAGGIAHNLNNMLTPILGYGEILKRKNDQKEFEKPLNSIIECSKKSRDLISQLLIFSRKKTMEIEVINLNNTIIEFKKLLDKTIRDNVEITISLDAKNSKIEADKKQIEQVLMNLIINAQDAIEGVGKISINTRNINLSEDDSKKYKNLEPGKFILLEVGDTGGGMEESTKKHIFEPFFTTKKEGEGTGLGLATVYGIVKQHNGIIKVSTEPGEGTTFQIYLPAVDKKISEKDEQTEQKKISSGSETILIAEDNTQVRNLTQGVLENLGYTVYSYSTGENVLADFEEDNIDNIDLLLTDIMMPGLNGKQLYKRVKNKYEEVKVIYISGYPKDTVLEQGKVKDDDVFIQKPFSYYYLVDKVNQVIN